MRVGRLCEKDYDELQVTQFEYCKRGDGRIKILWGSCKDRDESGTMRMHVGFSAGIT